MCIYQPLRGIFDGKKSHPIVYPSKMSLNVMMNHFDHEDESMNEHLALPDTIWQAPQIVSK